MFRNLSYRDRIQRNRFKNLVASVFCAAATVYPTKVLTEHAINDLRSDNTEFASEFANSSFENKVVGYSTMGVLVGFGGLATTLAGTYAAAGFIGYRRDEELQAYIAQQEPKTAGVSSEPTYTDNAAPVTYKFPPPQSFDPSNN